MKRILLIAGLLVAAETGFAQSIDSIRPVIAKIGDTVTIYGSSFQNTAQVHIRWRNFFFDTVSRTSTRIEVRVPASLRNGLYPIEVIQGMDTSNVHLIKTIDYAPKSVIGWGSNNYNEILIPDGLLSYNVVDVVASRSLIDGHRHSLALKGDGTVVGWGGNNHDQSNVPVTLKNVVHITAGNNYSAALISNGSVVTWGTISSTSITDAVDISAHEFALFVLKKSGAIVSEGNASLPIQHRFTIPTNSNFVRINMGYTTGLAITRDSSLVSFTNFNSTGIAIPQISKVIQADVGYVLGSYTGSALTSSGILYVVSSTGTATAFNVKEISVGDSHTIALFNNKTIRIFNGSGDLDSIPKNITWGNVYGISAGSFHNLALYQPVPTITFDSLLPVALTDSTLKLTASIDFDFPILYSSSNTSIADIFSVDSIQLRRVGTVVITAYIREKVDTVEFTSVKRNLYIRHLPTLRFDSLSPVVYGISPFPLSARSTVNVPILYSSSDTQIARIIRDSVEILSPGTTFITAYQQANDTVFAVSLKRYLEVRRRTPVITGVSHAVAELGDSVIIKGRDFYFSQIKIQSRVIVPLSLRDTQIIFQIPRDMKRGLYPFIIKNSSLDSSNFYLIRIIDFTSRRVAAWGHNTHGQLNIPTGLKDVAQLDVGEWHSIVLKTDGTAVSWGGYGHNNVSLPLIPVHDSLNRKKNIVAVDASDYHSMVLLNDGTVVSWGNEELARSEGRFYNQIAVPNTVGKVIAISSRDYHNLALRYNGTVVTWGNNAGTVPASVNNIVQISAGDLHSIVRKTDNTVIAWDRVAGLTNYGQSNVPSGLRAIQISAGTLHSLAIKTDSTVESWGNYNNTTVPDSLRNGRIKLIEISAGYSHSLALGKGGKVFSWGDTTYSKIPSWLNDISVSVGAGDNFSAVLTQKSSQLITFSPIAPQALSLVSFILKASSSSGLRITYRSTNTNVATIQDSLLLMHSIGTTTIIATQTGNDEYYAAFSVEQPLDIYNIVLTELSPVIVKTGDSVVFKTKGNISGASLYINGQNMETISPNDSIVRIPLGFSTGVHIARIKNATDSSNFLLIKVIDYTPKKIVTWGDNLYGQSNAPSGVTNAVAVSAGLYHNVVLRSDGTVIAWGLNNAGQVYVPNIHNIVSVEAGAFHSLALKNDGTVIGWGKNDFGESTTTLIRNVKNISGGYDHSLAVTIDGKVIGWGNRADGQLNIPNTLSNVKQVLAGNFFSLALKYDGTIAGWGNNSNSIISTATTKTNINAISGGKTIPSGTGNNIIALHADSTVSVWGSTNYSINNHPVGKFLKATHGDGQGMVITKERRAIQWGYRGDATPPLLREVVDIALGYSHAVALGFNKQSQTITFARVESQIINDTIILKARSSSGLSISYTSSDTSIALIKDSLLITRNKGTVTITANQYGNDDFIAATPVSQTIEVFVFKLTQLSPVIVKTGDSIVFKTKGNISGASLYINGQNMETISPNDSIVRIPLGFSTGVHIARIKNATDSSNFLLIRVIDYNPQGIVTWSGYELLVTTWTPYNQILSIINNRPNITDGVIVSSGLYYNVVLRANGTVVAWGSNEYSKSTVPPNLSNVVDISAGINHALALRNDGTVIGWGKTEQATIPDSIKNIKSISAGHTHSLAITVDGRVTGWGSNAAGQLNIPPNLQNVKTVHAASKHFPITTEYSLALKNDGTIAAWGTEEMDNSVITTSLQQDSIHQIDAEFEIIIALKQDSTITAWGWSQGYYWDDRPYSIRDNIPTGKFLKVSAGSDRAIAMRKDRTLIEWGGAAVTSGPPPYNYNFVPVGLYDVVDFSAGSYHYGVALGKNRVVQTITFTLPTKTIGDPNFAINATSTSGLPLSFSSSNTTIAQIINDSLIHIVTVGTVNITAIQTGNENWLFTSLTRTLTIKKANQTIDFVIDTIKSLSDTNPRLFAISSTGIPVSFSSSNTSIAQTVRYSSTDSLQLLSAGTTIITAYVPESPNYYAASVSKKLTITGPQITSVSPVIFSTTSDDSVVIKGISFSPTAQITVNGQTLSIIRRSSNTQITAIIPNTFQTGIHQVFVKNSRRESTNMFLLRVIDYAPDRIVTFSDIPQILNFGQAAPPSTHENFVDVSAGGNHSLALSKAGTITAWGWNEYGQTNVPADLHNVVQIAAGGWSHSLALKNDGTVIAWGSDSINSRFFGKSNVPPTLKNVIHIAAGSHSSYAISNDGTITGWGGYIDTSYLNLLKNKVTQIQGGLDYAIALKKDSTVTRLNDAPSSGYDYITPPPNLNNVLSIAQVGGYLNLALKRDSTIATWGLIPWKRGIRPLTAPNFQKPVPVDTLTIIDTVIVAYSPTQLTSISQIAAGYAFAGAINKNEKVHLWGYTLSDYYPGYTNERGFIAPFKEVKRLSIGDYHALAIGKPEKLNQSITFANIPSPQQCQRPVVLTASCNSRLPVYFSSSNTNIRITGNTVTPLSTGSFTITAFQTGNEYYYPAIPISKTVAITKATFPFSAFFLSETKNEIIGAVNTTNINIKILSPLGYMPTFKICNENPPYHCNNYLRLTGSVNIISYQHVNIPGFLPISKVKITITDSLDCYSVPPRIIEYYPITINTIPPKYCNERFPIRATTTSSLPISYRSSDTTIATIKGDTIITHSAGTVTITASFSGQEGYNSISQVMTIKKIKPVIKVQATFQNDTLTFALLEPLSSVPLHVDGWAIERELNGYYSTFDAYGTLYNQGFSNPLLIYKSASGASYHANYPYTAFSLRVVDTSKCYSTLDTSLFIYKKHTLIPKKTQTITLIDIYKTYGDRPFVVTATSSSSFPITYKIGNTNILSIDADVITIKKAGTTSVWATQNGNEEYLPDSTSANIIIAKAKQTISFDSISPKYITNDYFLLNASVSSSLRLSFSSSDIRRASVDASHYVTIYYTGTITITAYQEGNENYHPALPVTRTLIILPSTIKKRQTISFTAIEKTYGEEPIFLLAASTTSGLDISYSIAANNDVAKFIYDSRTIQILNAGTTSITARQMGNESFFEALSVTRTLIVHQANQTISFPPIPKYTLSFDNNKIPLLAEATSRLPVVSFTSSNTEIGVISDQYIILSKPGTILITAFQTGNRNYKPAESVDITLEIEGITIPELHIPNVFTPNNDGVNDILAPYTKISDTEQENYPLQNIYKYSVLIINTDGTTIVEKESVVNPPNLHLWNGTIDNKTTISGIFFYLITFEIKGYANTSTKKTYKGYVHVMR